MSVRLDTPGAVPVRVRGQFCYASADRGGAGGWQVLERTISVEPLLDALVHKTPTALESLVVVHDYPVSGMARRLMVTTVEGRSLGAWHSVPSGRDGSGRPGNVFTHGLVLYDDALRPAQLWESTQWLCPFGPHEVNLARLPADDAFSCHGMLHALGHFLFDPLHWRIGTLALLLDAVHAALAGGPRVVLLVSDHDEAARWIQAVQVCTDAHSAQRVHFSTFERHDAPQLESLGLHLAAVPAVDAAHFERRPGVVVIDCAQFPQLGGPDGQPHRTSRGDEVAATAWSRLLLERCVGPDDLMVMVSAIDELTKSHHSAECNDPAWPLALLCFEQDPTRRDAAAILARSSPVAVADHPRQRQSVAAALNLIMGSSAESQWQAIQELDIAGATPMVKALASANFVLHAIEDPDWLGSSQPRPTLDERLRPTLNDQWPESIRTALQTMVQAHPDATRVRAVVRACDLLDTLGWDQVPLIAGGLEAAADWIADALTAGIDGDEELSQARAATLLRIRGALFSAGHRPSLAMMIPGRVLDVVGVTSLEGLTAPEAWLDHGAEPAPLALEAAERILSDSGAYPPELRREAQFLRIHGALVEHRPLPAWAVVGPSGAKERAEASPEAPITTSHLKALLDRFGSRVPAPVIVGVILGTAPTEWPPLAEALRSAQHASAEFAEVMTELAAGMAAPVRGFGPTVRLLEDGLREVGRLPAQYAATAQLWAVAAALTQSASRLQQPGFFSATGVVGAKAAAKQVTEAAGGIVREMSGVWANEPGAGLWLLRSVGWYVPGSPAQSAHTRWVGQAAPAGLVEDLLLAVAQQYSIVVTRQAVEGAVVQLASRWPPEVDWHPLDRFLNRWVKEHGLDARRSAAAGRSAIRRRG